MDKEPRSKSSHGFLLVVLLGWPSGWPSFFMQTITRAEALAAGEMYYYTGAACKSGHISKRQVSNKTCVECSRMSTKKAFQNDYQRMRAENNKHKAAWSLKNKHKRALYDAEYRASKIRARPAWASSEAINAIYAEAHRLGHHVDHMVPLVSSVVCGLHVEHNLQILPPLENLRKGNRSWPNMP